MTSILEDKNAEQFRENIYPNLPKVIMTGEGLLNQRFTDDEHVLINSGELERRFRETLFRERTNEIKLHRQKAEERLTHFIKIKNRWTRADSILRYTGFSFIIICGGSATILASFVTSGIAIPAVAILVISGVSLVQSNIFETILKKLTSKRKRKYRNKINETQSYLDKMYIIFEKARYDKEITNEELETIRNLSLPNYASVGEDISLQEELDKIENSFKLLRQKIAVQTNNRPSAPELKIL